jgi:digeranylgeranylglycerophospholipid reductase
MHENSPTTESTSYDATIIGGSVAGLLAARELSTRGFNVAIFEEHREIGIPEKCDGLVSAQGINNLGLAPPSSVIQNTLKKAIFFSPSMKEITIDAQRQNVIVLDRSRFDKYLAELAAKAGANILIGKRVSRYSEDDSKVSVKIDDSTVQSEILIDCGGYESYISAGGRTLQGGQFLVFGNWFSKDTVEVYFDPIKYPGFFKWVIPISSNTAKIGVAGEGINTFQILDKFALEKKAQVLRKMAAPVLCFGTTKSFVKGKIVRAGDAAGQAKPTTGGGIYTGGKGGLLAGTSVANALETNNVSYLSNYEDEWKREFGREFEFQNWARGFLSKLTREQVDRLFEMIAASDVPQKISEEADFDQHSLALIKAFGLSNVISSFGMFLTNELKQLIHR